MSRITAAMLLSPVVLCLVGAASAEEACTAGNSGVCRASAGKPSSNKGVHLMQMKPTLSRSLLSKPMHEELHSSCCDSCAGSAFCSPQSMTCYATQAKSYYISCPASGGSGEGDGGLAPSPPTPALPACCGGCRTEQWCSPKSSSCYDIQAKPYYQPCGDDPRDRVVVDEIPTWADEFDNLDGSGRVNASNWVYENGDNFANNQELQFYTDRSDNSYVQDGVLKIVAKCEDYSNWGYTSARLTTQRQFDWGPGHRIEVKARVPTGRGTWPAIWMLPSDNTYGGWPHSGEIDIMESVGCTSGKVYGTVHTGAFNHMKNTQRGNHYYTDNGDWHTYTIDWLDHKIKWYVDGELYHNFSPDISDSQQWPFNQKFYMILNVAVAGSWGGFCLDERPSCSHHDEFGQEQVMEVDYARVYKIHKQEQSVQE